MKNLILTVTLFDEASGQRRSYNLIEPTPKACILKYGKIISYDEYFYNKEKYDFLEPKFLYGVTL